MKTKFDDFTEAFIIFLRMNVMPYSVGGVGEYKPMYSNCEIRIKLNENGSGYIHLLGEDSDTFDFMTIDHFRSQDMITPTQREEISKLTCAKATKIVREENKRLKEEINRLRKALDLVYENISMSESNIQAALKTPISNESKR